MKSFSELLKNYRAKLKMTQQQLGDRLKLSPPYIAQIETGLKPPPQAKIIQRMAENLHLDEDEAQDFAEIAEYEREHQSLVKATRKLGFAVSGNLVLVPEKLIFRATEREIAELFKKTEEEAQQGIFIAGIGGEDWGKAGFHSPILRSRIEMQAWLLDYLGNEPSVGLALLGTLYASIRLVDDKLALNEPTALRRKILAEIHDPGSVLSLMKSAIDQAKEAVHRREHPHVTQSEDAGTPVVPQSATGQGLHTVQVAFALEEGAETLHPATVQEAVDIPASWLEEGAEYQAVAINGDAFSSLGLWPGSRAIVQREAVPRNEDLVLIRVAGELSIKRYFALGMDLFLQGGGPSSPTLQVRRDQDVVVEGVVRQLISQFGELQRAKARESQEE